MKAIWKYDLPHDTNYVSIPKDFVVLSVAEQNNNIVLYCIVDPYGVTEEVEFNIVGTGWHMPDSLLDKKFIGTVSTYHGMYMWHIFQS